MKEMHDVDVPLEVQKLCGESEKATSHYRQGR